MPSRAAHVGWVETSAEALVRTTVVKVLLLSMDALDHIDVVVFVNAVSLSRDDRNGVLAN